MDSFNNGFWNLFIVVCTLGGLLGLLLLTMAYSRGRPGRRFGRRRRRA